MKVCGIRSCLMVIQGDSKRRINSINRNMVNIHNMGGKVEIPLVIRHPINRILNGHLVIQDSSQDILGNITGIHHNQDIPGTLNNLHIQGILVNQDIINSIIPDSSQVINTDTKVVNHNKVHRLLLHQAKRRVIPMPIYVQSTQAE